MAMAKWLEAKMFRLTQRKSVEFFESKELTELGFVTHAFCTRRSGVSQGEFASLNVGDEEKNVIQNLNIIRDSFAMPENAMVMARQVHGDRILEIDEQDSLPVLVREADGLMTARAGLAICIKTADCAPLLFVDRRLRVIGAVHAGWRGTALRIASKMVDMFSERFSSRREDIMVFIGPAIGPCCYEVDSPVFEAFSADRDRDGFFHRLDKKDRWGFDLLNANRLQLMKAGIPEDHVQGADICTSCWQDLFYSHRAAKGRKEGRQLNFIMLNAT
jgi:YfiH family protein